jgi:hypothetical protein
MQRADDPAVLGHVSICRDEAAVGDKCPADLDDGSVAVYELADLGQGITVSVLHRDVDRIDLSCSEAAVPGDVIQKLSKPVARPELARGQAHQCSEHAIAGDKPALRIDHADALAHILQSCLENN